MDGSARDFVAAIDEAGVAPLAAPRRALRVTRPVRVSAGAGWAELRPIAHGLHLDVEIAFPGGVGRQRLALDLTPDTFRARTRSARTFGFLGDAERLWRDGLALGAIARQYDRHRRRRACSTRRGCASPTNSCAIRCSTSSAISRSPARLSSAPSAPIAAAIGLNLALIEAAARAGALELEVQAMGAGSAARAGSSLSP